MQKRITRGILVEVESDVLLSKCSIRSKGMVIHDQTMVHKGNYGIRGERDT